MSRRARLQRLERQDVPQVGPWLSLGRSDRDSEAEGVGFEGCPLRREPGEAWGAFTARAQQWAQGRLPFLAWIIYRESAA